MVFGNRQVSWRHSKIWARLAPDAPMHPSGFISKAVPVSVSTLITVALLLAWPFSQATQKTALHLNGTQADPFEASPGKPVVLVFVRTDCPISNRYAPLIQRISSQYAAKVGFWLVYPGKTTSAEKIRQHESDYGYKLPALRDPQHALVMQAQVQVTPEAAVFDANHRLVYHGRIDNLYEDVGRARPAATTHELDDAIQAALTGNAPPPNTPAVGCYIADLE
jgi:thiol-disulfide isomerase/thioredoxin